MGRTFEELPKFMFNARLKVLMIELRKKMDDKRVIDLIKESNANDVLLSLLHSSVLKPGYIVETLEVANLLFTKGSKSEEQSSEIENRFAILQETWKNIQIETLVQQ